MARGDCMPLVVNGQLLGLWISPSNQLFISYASSSTYDDATDLRSVYY